MADPLLQRSDVEAALVRPLTDTEAQYIDALIAQVSQQLRAKMPTVDTRLEAEGDLTAELVAGVLADVIARRLLNPRRLWSAGGESIGPYTSPSETYPGPRGGDAVESFGNLVITAADLAQLGVGGTFTPGTIRTAPTRWLS